MHREKGVKYHTYEAKLLLDFAADYFPYFQIYILILFKSFVSYKTVLRYARIKAGGFKKTHYLRPWINYILQKKAYGIIS